MNKTINYYNTKAKEVFKQYQSADAEVIHSSWSYHLKGMSGLALDIGAGSGRDASWLSNKGFEVFAIEPADKLREMAKQKYLNPKIHWFSDMLPELKSIYRLNIKFDVILLSAVWMHIPISSRERAFRKIANLLKPSGKLVISLRHGKSPDEREMYEVSFSEINNYAKSQALTVLTHKKDEDKLNRDKVIWETVVFQLPDDGTGSFPLLRNIIINDNKSSTYKLALLRVLLRIADGMPGVAREYDDDHMAIPLGLVSLFWLRQYHQLLNHDLQQLNDSKKEPGFIKDNGYRQLNLISTNDLSISYQFNGEESTALFNTLKHVSSLIKRMPVHYLTYPGTDKQIFSVSQSRIKDSGNLILNLDKLNEFGNFIVPKMLWSTMTQYSVWIEPAIIHEWITLMQGYMGSTQNSEHKLL